MAIDRDSDDANRMTGWQKLVLWILLAGVVVGAAAGGYHKGLADSQRAEQQRLEQRIEYVVDVVNMHGNAITVLEDEVRRLHGGDVVVALD